MFSVFCSAAARSGNRKNGPEPTPATRAPIPVHLMKSRRDSPSCFFFAILLPSEEQLGSGKLTSRMEKSLPEPMRILRGRASQSLETAVARLFCGTEMLAAPRPVERRQLERKDGTALRPARL